MQVPVNISNYLMVMARSPYYLQPKLFYTESGRRFLQQAHDEVLDILRIRNLTLTQLIDAVSLSCEEMIVKCSFGSHAFTAAQCCSVAQPITTLLGRCYLLYSDDGQRQLSSGDYMGYILYLYDVSDHEPEIMPSILESSYMAKTGVQVTLISNVTLPSYDVSGDGAVITPGTLTSMELSLTKVNFEGVRQLVDWDESPCVPPWQLRRQPLHSLLRTSVNCELAKNIDCFSFVCDRCFVYAHWDFLQGEVQEPCTAEEAAVCYGELYKMNISGRLDGVKRCIDQSRARCVRVCEEMYYSHTTVVSPIPPAQRGPLTQDLRLANGTKVSVVAVFYPELRYILITNSRDGILDVLGKLGGYMGLLLGCSLITAAESIVFPILSFCSLGVKLCRHLTSRLRNL